MLEGLQGPLNDEQKESLHTAKDCCDQMVFMMNDILDAARIETGKLSLQCERGSIADVLAKAVRNCQSPAMRRGVTLDSSVAEDTEHAYFDAQIGARNGLWRDLAMTFKLRRRRTRTLRQLGRMRWLATVPRSGAMRWLATAMRNPGFRSRRQPTPQDLAEMSAAGLNLRSGP